MLHSFDQIESFYYDYILILIIFDVFIIYNGYILILINSDDLWLLLIIFLWP